MLRRKLSKESEQELAWQWHTDAGLQLIYKTFARFVESRTGIVLGANETSDLDEVIA